MSQTSRILIVDDDPIVADSLSEHLRREGYGTATACDGNEALSMVEAANAPAAVHRGDGDAPFGLIICDMNMPRRDGLELLKIIRKQFASIAMIMITGFGKIEGAVETIKLGAVEYLTKPIVDDELRIAVGKAMQQHALLAENLTLKSQLSERFGMDNIVGGDYRMQKIYELIETVAPTRTTVLIEGDSGTGKSMVARALHTRSDRSAGPFVTFSCGAIPETLLESELFGHVKGAFTGADTNKPGKILAADGGTLFIDEINSATPALQLKLLRVLQEKQFEPLGSTQTKHVDVRFILATNQPLKEQVDKGEFREDLYYRINVVNIGLPSLRHRIGDLQILADHFIEKYCKEMNKTITGYTDSVLQALHRHNWPGNVRELENAIERAVVLCRRPVIDIEDMPETIRDTSDGAAPMPAMSAAVAPPVPGLDAQWSPTPLTRAMEEPERRIILAALEANGWNRQETARQLEINRTTLYKKIKQYHLDEPA
jgi:DNA-binding NtrC family response regulator